jgi:small-conductance mechanosensitive channel
MATQNSFADLMDNWQSLLAACGDHPETLAPAEPQRAALEKLFKEARDIRTQQESAKGAKQELRQRLDQVLRDGREAARRLRAVVKGNLGTNNERLVQFDVAPVRKRGPRKPKEKETPPPEEAKTGAPQKPSTADGQM